MQLINAKIDLVQRTHRTTIVFRRGFGERTAGSEIIEIGAMPLALKRGVLTSENAKIDRTNGPRGKLRGPHFLSLVTY